MNRAIRSIPVNLTNPGQVIACLGLAETHAQLTSDADLGCWFDDSSFNIRYQSPSEPVETLIGFLANCDVFECQPVGYEPSKTARCKTIQIDDWPERQPETSKLAVMLRDKAEHSRALKFGHWCDGSDRDSFKLYAGNRSAGSIIDQLLKGKGKSLPGLLSLLTTDRQSLLNDPLGECYPMAGGFNMDPRAGWQAIDMGYSPNEQSHQLYASPLLEILAALGLQYSRPRCTDGRYAYQYATWTTELQLPLARLALANALPYCNAYHYQFRLVLSGKNKVITFATEIDE